MAPNAEASPSEQSGGGDARELYHELTDDLLYDPAIGRATMMGYPCVRLASPDRSLPSSRGMVPSGRMVGLAP
jgi:hypothetical protein